MKKALFSPKRRKSALVSRALQRYSHKNANFFGLIILLKKPYLFGVPEQ